LKKVKNYNQKKATGKYRTLSCRMWT